MADLVEAIERLQPSDHPAAQAGIHPEIILPVMKHPLLRHHAALRVCRAMQHVAITRPYRRQQEAPPLALFGATPA